MSLERSTLSRRRRSKQRAARLRRARARRTHPSHERLSASARVDVQVTSGPYGAYLQQVAETVGERAWAAMGELEREAWVADLLLAAHVVPFRESLPYAAFRAQRAAGAAGVNVDENTRRSIDRFVRGEVLKAAVRVRMPGPPTARGAAKGGGDEHGAD